MNKLGDIKEYDIKLDIIETIKSLSSKEENDLLDFFYSSPLPHHVSVESLRRPPVYNGSDISEELTTEDFSKPSGS